MIVDTSALVAIVTGEPGSEALSLRLTQSPDNVIPSPTVVELTAVLRQVLGASDVGELLRRYDITVVPFDESTALAATRTYLQYGKGSGHPARLNLGDAYVAGMALDRGEPVLFTGQGFGKVPGIVPA